ncbi:hypothetical protein LOC68_10125 [Blastopirellula sp. JC732]|uniref:Uncharacterized protein n=1 Tax=Blastopirellula sediminis TaxID=2894196 RepID=A0A9X1MLF2_9BACT|nr:hypothetical protein [Blastopirellula sediminis]MCC9608467.1 hypothetical protein [Blastopirellula sediminis]MCC9628756.1 hypothetical protein [Blastopirellula sediminis]
MLLTLCISATSARAQVLSGYRPRYPGVDPYGSRFTYLVNEGTLLLGTITQIEKTGKEDIDKWHHPDYIELRLTLAIDRVIFGKPFHEQTLKIESLWYVRDSWLAVSENKVPPQVGDKVLYSYFPPDKYYPREIFFAPASESELKRLDRIAEILTTRNDEQAAQRILVGCLDPDPFFARWCLSVSDAQDTVTDRNFLTAYGRVRAPITSEQKIDACWQLLKDPKCHSLVYEFVNYRLAARSLTNQEQLARFDCHLRRLEALSEMDSVSPDERYYGEREISFLVRTGYKSAPLSSRLEALQTLKRMAEDEECIFRLAAIRDACFLHEAGQPALSKALFQFYRDCRPAQMNLDRHTNYLYLGGLLNLMQDESKATKSVHHEGLQQVEAMISQSAMPVACSAVSRLCDYARFCEKEKIAWPDLPHYFEALIAITPDENVRNSLRNAAKQFGAAPRQEVPTF